MPVCKHFQLNGFGTLLRFLRMAVGNFSFRKKTHQNSSPFACLFGACMLRQKKCHKLFLFDFFLSICFPTSQARAQGLQVDSEFEVHPVYQQPTYKALFDRAFQAQFAAQRGTPIGRPSLGQQMEG